MSRRAARTSLVWLGVLGALLSAAALGVFLTTGGGRDVSGPTRVGVVEIRGVLDLAEPYLDQLQEFQRDQTIGAVVLRIDSPGGLVGPAQEIHREVRRFRERKPVVASLAAVAASGGYYVASAADAIVANPGTTTGSIGVIMPLGNARELLGKIGVESTPVFSGRFKEAGTPTRSLTAEERALFQGLVDDLHAQFIQSVAEGRQMPAEKVAAVSDGRVFTGRQAVDYGLVDRLGNFRDAVELAWERAGLKGEPRVAQGTRKKGSLIGRLLNDWLRETLGQALTAAGLGVEPAPLFLWR